MCKNNKKVKKEMSSYLDCEIDEIETSTTDKVDKMIRPDSNLQKLTSKRVMICLNIAIEVFLMSFEL